MIEYKIIEKKWVDSHGKVRSGHTHYTIMYKAKFLFWYYWEPVMHEVCYESGCYKTATEFKTIEQAKEFADNFASKGIRTNTWVNKVVITK